MTQTRRVDDKKLCLREGSAVFEKISAKIALKGLRVGVTIPARVGGSGCLTKTHTVRFRDKPNGVFKAIS